MGGLKDWIDVGFVDAAVWKGKSARPSNVVIKKDISASCQQTILKSSPPRVVTSRAVVVEPSQFLKSLPFLPAISASRAVSERGLHVNRIQGHMGNPRILGMNRLMAGGKLNGRVFQVCLKGPSSHIRGVRNTHVTRGKQQYRGL